jgi:hypothetical protein
LASNLSCCRARFAFMTFRPVLLDLCVQALTLSLHFRTFFLSLYQVRAEQIEFVIQNDELANEFVFYLAAHYLIILYSTTPLGLTPFHSFSEAQKDSISFQFHIAAAEEMSAARCDRLIAVIDSFRFAQPSNRSTG